MEVVNILHGLICYDVLEILNTLNTDTMVAGVLKYVIGG